MDCFIAKPFADFPDHAWLQSELTTDDSLGRSLLKASADIASKRNIAWHKILESCNGNLMALELQQEGREQYALLLPDPSEPGRFRAQFFDPRGFFGHITRDTPWEILCEVVREGYLNVVTGVLNTLSQTGEWKRGSLATNLIAEVNLGRISFSDMLEQLKHADADVA